MQKYWKSWNQVLKEQLTGINISLKNKSAGTKPKFTLLNSSKFSGSK